MWNLAQLRCDEGHIKTRSFHVLRRLAGPTSTRVVQACVLHTLNEPCSCPPPPRRGPNGVPAARRSYLAHCGVPREAARSLSGRGAANCP
jgi:hypothetical protein